jgi:hypothetical protein
MATIALAAASGFEAGTAGYALAAMLGSVIDNTLVFPSLFPADPIEGMRVGEVQIMGADEGTPAAKCYGAEAKVGGQIIWAGALQEVQTSNHSGKNTNRIEYTYYLDCAVVCCHTDGNALASIERVWADEKQVFVDPGVFNGITVTDEDGIGVYVENWSTYWIFFDETVNANVKANVYDLFSVGSRVTYTGFTNSGNNDTACEILEKRKKILGQGGRLRLPRTLRLARQQVQGGRIRAGKCWRQRATRHHQPDQLCGSGGQRLED